MEQHERWVAARARLGAPVRPKPRRKTVGHPLWVPTLLLLSPPPPDWSGAPMAPYDHYVPPPKAPRPGPYQWRDIIEQVAQKHGVFMSDMRSVRRGRPLVAARHEAMWRLKRETSMSLPEIGRRLGGRDHTTVIHGIKAHQERIDKGTAK
jgi:hypothetical protein